MRFDNIKWILFFAALCLTSGVSAVSAQKIQVDLYHGQNSDVRNDVQEGRPLRRSFDKLFGYKMYEKLGSAECQIETGYDQWLLPSKAFFLRVGRVDDKRASLELFEGEKSIVSTQFDPKRSKPLIIRGPFYANGQLVLVVKTK